MDYFTDSLLKKVNNRITGREIKDIWYKYENSETLESKFICDINKFKLIL
jgi:putative hydrolase of HD superfamily